MRSHESGGVQYRLVRPWRRGLLGVAVAALAGAAAPAYSQDPSRPLLVVSVICGVAAILCLWLLADATWPWINHGVEPGVSAAADAALRRAYSVLALLAVGAIFYLNLRRAPELAALVHGRERTVLWTLAGIVLLLPAALASWNDTQAGVALREVRPWELVRARLSGASGRLHRTAALALLASVPVLIVTVTPGADRSVWWYGAVWIALLSLAGCVWVFARSLQHEARGNDHI